MQTRTEMLSELMKVQHKKALLSVEIEQMEERETFLKQNMEITDTPTSAPAKKTGKAAKQLAMDLDDDDTTETEDEDDNIVPAKSTKKTTASSTGKKGKGVEALMDSEGEEDLDDALGSADEDDDAPTIGDDEVRKLCTQIVKSKGEAGKKKARVVMAKYTKNKSGMVKDILKGSHAKIYAELQKI